MGKVTKVIKKQKRAISLRSAALHKLQRSSPTTIKRGAATTAAASPCSIKRRYPRSPIGKAWPRKELVWYSMPPPCDQGPLLRDVMKERGWRHMGLPCHCVKTKCCPRTWDDSWGWTVFMKEFSASLQGKSPGDAFGKAGQVEEGYRLKTRKLSKHALWMLGSCAYRLPGSVSKFRDQFAIAVQAYGKGLPDDGRYRMLSFPGMETALRKTHLSEAFRGKHWFPRCYTIPDEKNLLLKDIKSAKVNRNNYWICKPPNAYGGEGITVFHGNDKRLAEVIKESSNGGRQVVQHYLADPYLIGGYKFHVRLHLVITSLDPPEAFVQMNGQCLFATEPYVLSPSTTGDNFRAPTHVTNMCLNATEKNKENYFKKKPVIGSGQQFRVKFLEQYLAKNYPGYDSNRFWKQVLDISAETVLYISKARSVRQFGKYPPNRFFEIFGMDLMLDKHLNVFMCEVNTTPGLDYPDKQILGAPNPDYEKESSLSSDTWHDLLALLGLDASVRQTRGSLKNWLQVGFDSSSVA